MQYNCIIPNLVFTKLPPKTIDIKEGSSSRLTCEMKAPSDSMVYWTQKQVPENEECQIPIKNKNRTSPNYTDSILLCNTTAIVSKTVKEVDKDYSIFYLELQVRKQYIIILLAGLDVAVLSDS